MVYHHSSGSNMHLRHKDNAILSHCCLIWLLHLTPASPLHCGAIQPALFEAPIHSIAHHATPSYILHDIARYGTPQQGNPSQATSCHGIACHAMPLHGMPHQDTAQSCHVTPGPLTRRHATAPHVTEQHSVAQQAIL